jgi:hypothetical protein
MRGGLFRILETVFCRDNPQVGIPEPQPGLYILSVVGKVTITPVLSYVTSYFM